jgi:hypothetical protein
LSREYHILNLGAGVQSTTLYLMFMAGMVEPQIDYAIFADTQDEPKAVYRHLDWMDSLGGPPILRRTKGKLSDALIRGVNSTNQRWISIPAFTPSADDPEETSKLRRQCSSEYKINVIRQTVRSEVMGLRPRQAAPKGTVLHQYIGISLDESGRAARMKRRKFPKYQRFHFPLIDNFLTRENCLTLLRSKFAVPHEVPRSACVYCPFHNDAEWLRIKADPAEWAEAVKVDEALRSVAVTANRKRKNTQPMFLHRSLQPLVQIEFNPNPSPRDKQLNINFARECMGVCGV